MDPRIKDVVLNLSQKFLLFIVSSTNTNPIRAFLKQNNLENCFREIYGNDVHASKVEKIGILLKQYTLDPKDCLFITDTVGDIREARKCNVDSVAVTWGYHSREMLEREKPVAVVDRSEELGDFISKRFS